MTVDVLQLTDTHLRGTAAPLLPPVEFSDAVALLTGRSADELAASVVTAALERRAGRLFDVALHTGDIADPVSDSGYDDARALLRSAGHTVLATPGNHDSPEGFVRVLGGSAQPLTVHHDVGAWRVVLISSAQPPHSAGHYQTEALEAVASAVDVDRPVALATHHPPVSPCSDPECCTANAWSLLDIIDRHSNVKMVLSGHLHVADEITRRGVNYYVSPSTALQLRHIHPLPDNNHAATDVGARVLRLHDDGTHDTHIEWLGDGPSSDAG